MHQRDLRPADEELVRDLARKLAASQQDEAVILAHSGRGAASRDGDEIGFAAGWHDDRRRDVERSSGRGGLRRQSDTPGSAAVACVGDADEERLAVAAATDVQVPEREGRRLGEDARRCSPGQVHQAPAFECHRRLLRPRGVRPRRKRCRNERRLHLRRRPARMELQQERGRAGDVRRRHARPVEDRKRRAAGELRQRRGEDLSARR